MFQKRYNHYNLMFIKYNLDHNNKIHEHVERTNASGDEQKDSTQL